VAGGGSYAAAAVHDRIRTDKRDADLRLVRAGIQQIIDNLADLNGWPRPRFEWTIEKAIQKERADRDAILMGSIDLTEQYFARAYDFEPGDFEIKAPAIVPPALAQAQGIDTEDEDAEEGEAPNSEGEDEEAAEVVMAKQRFTPEQEAIEGYVKTLADTLSDPVPVEDVRAAIRAARDPQDLEDRLALLIERDSPDYRKTLAKALYTAHVLVYINAKE